MPQLNIVLLFLILVFLAVERIKSGLDSTERWERVDAFMQVGPRNTAEMGYALCLRVAHLEKEHHAKSPDETCWDVYYGDHHNGKKTELGRQ